MEIDMKSFVEKNFSIYAAMTIQNRALCDVRDILKPSQRLCMYSQYINNLTYKKPYQKSAASIAAATSFGYAHGDSSLYGLLVRLAKTFCMNYPLVDFEGQYTIHDGDAHAAFRYTAMRLGELGTIMFDGVNEDAIDVWLDNYDNTGKYPAVLPSLGYYNICNGLMGLATAVSSSIPQFNVKEVNEAMIKLLWDRDIDFEEIYCEPDFCTGGIILNGREVKESLKCGTGKAIILRSKIEYDSKENCLYATELPYAIYTTKLMEQLKALLNNGELRGVKHVLDLSKKTSNIKIELEKGANVTRVVKELYKKTMLQSAFTINMTMLKDGKKPVVFGWKDALLEHIVHEEECYTRIYNYKLKKLAERLNIVDGILKAIANINEVIETIKKSEDKKSAKENLIQKFGFNAPQTDAILKITLSKLAHLESIAYEKERQELLEKKDYYTLVLSDKNELYKIMEKQFRAIAEKFAQPRKTEIINLDYKNNEEDAEPIEKKELLIYYTNLGNLYTTESSTLLRTRRGGKGSKLKLAANETIEQVISDSNYNSLLVFSNKGKMYHLSINDLPIDSKVNIQTLFNFEANEKPTALTSCGSREQTGYFFFITKNGLIKKTAASEYSIRRGKSIKAINLKDDDEVVTVLFGSFEKVGILTFNGNYVIINTEEITSIGRNSMGVKAIKLSSNDYVIDAKLIKPHDKYLITLSKNGLIKKADIEEFPLCSRATKGRAISGIQENDKIVKFLTISTDCDIIIISKRKSIKISTDELRTLSRVATGVKSLDIAENDSAQDLKVSINE